MSDRPIIGRDAALYIDHVVGHGLHQDTQWLIDVGRFPVGCRILDVGCGTGTLIAALAGEKQFARSIHGVELSPELADHAQRKIGVGGVISQADFLVWTPPEGWQPDTVVMSYYLHHTGDVVPHLKKAAGLLPHGGRLYVFDRLALDRPALDTFPRFWEERYRQAHEWQEEMPNLMTFDSLADVARACGFDLVRRTVCTHDRRAGVEGFPKTLMEFWLHEPGRCFPAVLVVSPAHQAYIDEVVQRLASEGLHSAERRGVSYSDDLLRIVYERCPWREPLIRFVAEVCPSRVAMAIPLAGDYTTPELLDRLSTFKKERRKLWPDILGPKDGDGIQGVILPFHVPEPYEAEDLAAVIGLPTQGRS
ncbi:MAG: class I SAM-dependent methyltransferase [Isosphaeraceae bacterium]